MVGVIRYNRTGDSNPINTSYHTGKYIGLALLWTNGDAESIDSLVKIPVCSTNSPQAIKVGGIGAGT